jgi:hypothetical protein
MTFENIKRRKLMTIRNGMAPAENSGITVRPSEEVTDDGVNSWSPLKTALK